MSHTGARPIHVGLLVALVAQLTIAGFSTSVLPRLLSPCGRLAYVPVDDSSLATNQVRLQVPEGRSWERVEARFRVPPGEALSLIVGRAPGALAGTYTVIRISGVDSLASGVLRFVDDRVVETNPVSSSPAGSSWTDPVTVTRVPAAKDAEPTLEIRIGTMSPIVVPAARDPGGFEAALFPPSSPALHDRLTLGTVTLDDGSSLPRRFVPEVATSAWFQLLIVLVLGVWRWQSLAAWLGRRFPAQFAGSPAAITVWLVFAIGVVSLLKLIPRYELLPTFDAKQRLLYRVLLGVAVAACWIFAWLRERFVRRFPGALRSRFFHPALVPVQAVLTTAGILVVFVAFQFSFARFEPPEERPPGASTARIRVAALGGSQTRGYPFPKGWPGAFPALLETRLTETLHQPVAVWNFGVDSAGLDHIVEHLPARLAAASPTHLLVNSLVNSAPGGREETYRASLTRFLAATRGGAAQVILVKEPDLEPVYGHSRWPSIAGFYPVLDELASQARVAVVDPVPALRAHRDEFLFMDDVHFTPHGHRVMAAALGEALAPLLASTVDSGSPPPDSAPPPARGSSPAGDGTP